MAGKIFKAIVFALVLLIPVGVSHAAVTGKIVGRVVDAESGEGLIGANIVVVGTMQGATTDLDGNYFILNISPGTYEVKATMLGYIEVLFQNVQVQSDRTTDLDFELGETVLEVAEAVVYIAERPMIRRDATDSRTTRTADDIKLMPVESIRDVIALTAGTAGSNFRGGRATEVQYFIDGAAFMDPMTGNYEGFVPQIAFEEVNVITGGMSVEYGNSLSGVVTQVTKEGRNRFDGSLNIRTSDFGENSEDIIGTSDRMKDVQASLSGPIPFVKGLGSLNFFLSGQYFDTQGRLPTDDSTLTSSYGKLTYQLTPRHKMTFSGGASNAYYHFYNVLYSRPTVEDHLFRFDPYLDDGGLDPETPWINDGATWWDNGVLDTEDLNRNGILDPGEDRDADGVIDTEDLNHSGSLDIHDMQEHTLYYFHHTDNFAVKWNHAINNRTFYELSVSRYKTQWRYNIRERINEDANGNGSLDLERYYDPDSAPEALWNLVNNGDIAYGWNADGTEIYFDENGNGVRDWEDLNGNELWDWDVYGPQHDLFVDYDDNDIVDASEGAGLTPMAWVEIPFGFTKDNDGYSEYGLGYTFYRLRWNHDYKEVWTVKGNITSQMHKYHQVKSGFELKFMDILDHDVDLASGGNIYGQNTQVEPRLYGAWVEDKMEFEGMVVNAGIRADVLDMNFDNFPSDLDNPVTDVRAGGEVKDPTGVDLKFYWGPRLGVAFPITDRDLLSFNYSRNFQAPVFQYAFMNVTWSFTGAFPRVGNADIEPERTTAYEITLRHQFAPDLAISGTGYYKDITGLVDTRQVFYTAANYYSIYINQDYGNVRGFEVNLDKRFSNFYSGNINYSYSVAKGKSSTTRQNASLAWAGYVLRTTEVYLDWDQRHVINGNVQFMIPKGTRPFGIGALDEFSLSLIGRYASGLPYSSPAHTLDPPINDQRLPSWYVFDGRIQKRHSFNNNMAAFVYLQVYNLFNQRNMNQDYFQWYADIEWYVADQDGDGEPDHDVDGKYDDPRYWQRSRIYQLGLGFEF